VHRGAPRELVSPARALGTVTKRSKLVEFEPAHAAGWSHDRGGRFQPSERIEYGSMNGPLTVSRKRSTCQLSDAVTELKLLGSRTRAVSVAARGRRMASGGPVCAPDLQQVDDRARP
jgi:hypothetical protein